MNAKGWLKAWLATNKKDCRLFLSSGRHRYFRYSDGLAVRTDIARQLNGVSGVFFELAEVLILNPMDFAFVDQHILLTGLNAVHNAVVSHTVPSAAHARGDLSGPGLLSGEARPAGY